MPGEYHVATAASAGNDATASGTDKLQGWFCAGSSPFKGRSYRRQIHMQWVLEQQASIARQDDEM